MRNKTKVAVAFLDAAHHLRQGLVQRVRCIDGTTVIVEILVARLPLLPFFPRGDLEIGNLPFAAFQPAFLHFLRALTMHNQHGRVEHLPNLYATLVGAPVGKGCVNNNTQPQFELFLRQGKHQLIRKMADLRYVPENIDRRLT